MIIESSRRAIGKIDMSSYPTTSNFTLRASTAFVLEKLGFNPAYLRYRVMLFLPPPEMEIIKRPGGRKYTRCNFCNRNVKSAKFHREKDNIHKWVCTKRCVEVTDRKERKRAWLERWTMQNSPTPKRSILYKCTECNGYLIKSDILSGHRHHPVYNFSPTYTHIQTHPPLVEIRPRNKYQIMEETSMTYCCWGDHSQSWRRSKEAGPYEWLRLHWGSDIQKYIRDNGRCSRFPWRHPGTGPRRTTLKEFNIIRECFGIPPIPAYWEQLWDDDGVLVGIYLVNKPVIEIRADGSKNEVTFVDKPCIY